MTNGNVEQSVAAVDEPTLSVKYKDGEKKLLVTPETVAAAKKQLDWTSQTPRITYGRNGAGPAFDSDVNVARRGRLQRRHRRSGRLDLQGRRRSR
jgi:hypothetical protein